MIEATIRNDTLNHVIKFLERKCKDMISNDPYTSVRHLIIWLNKFKDQPFRYTKLDTQQAIEILSEDGSIYWTEEGYDNCNSIDWNAIAVFFNTDEIHTYCQGMVTRIYSDKRYLPWGLGL